MRDSSSIDILQNEGKDKWDEFVLGREESTYCHLAGWRDVLVRSYGLPCFFLQLQDRGKLRAVLPLVHLKGPIAPNRLVSIPFLDHGGILSEVDELTEQLVDFATDLARRLGAKGLDLRAPLLGAYSPADEDSRYSFVLPLPDSEKELWKAVGPKVRNQVRKSEKAGLYSKVVTAEQLPEFFRIFSRNMRDLGSPTHSIAFFRNLLQVMSKQCRLYLTYDKNECPVAGGIAFSFRNTVTVPWASSLRSRRSDCPNHSLYWRVLRDSQIQGARVFDFGRSSQGTGTYQFKKQWGTEIHPLRWTFLDNHRNPEKDYYLKPRRNSIVVSIWRRLPLSTTVWLGPLIRQQLPN
jgi:serine/alanine adding enzyme